MSPRNLCGAAVLFSLVISSLISPPINVWMSIVIAGFSACSSAIRPCQYTNKRSVFATNSDWVIRSFDAGMNPRALGGGKPLPAGASAAAFSFATSDGSVAPAPPVAPALVPHLRRPRADRRPARLIRVRGGHGRGPVGVVVVPPDPDGGDGGGETEEFRAILELHLCLGPCL
jgi:hypothetical protein